MTRATSELIIEPAIVRKNISYLKAKLDDSSKFMAIIKSDSYGHILSNIVRDIDDIVDGLIRIAESDEKHEDAWELGTGNNYSLNEVYEMFKEKFNSVKVYMSEEKGNYRETIRINDDALNRLGWQPKDQLKEYINEIKLRNNGL